MLPRPTAVSPLSAKFVGVLAVVLIVAFSTLAMAYHLNRPQERLSRPHADLEREMSQVHHSLQALTNAITALTSAAVSVSKAPLPTHTGDPQVALTPAKVPLEHVESQSEDDRNINVTEFFDDIPVPEEAPASTAWTAALGKSHKSELQKARSGTEVDSAPSSGSTNKSDGCTVDWNDRLQVTIYDCKTNDHIWLSPICDGCDVEANANVYIRAKADSPVCFRMSAGRDTNLTFGISNSRNRSHECSRVLESSSSSSTTDRFLSAPIKIHTREEVLTFVTVCTSLCNKQFLFAVHNLVMITPTTDKKYYRLPEAVMTNRNRDYDVQLSDAGLPITKLALNSP